MFTKNATEKYTNCSAKTWDELLEFAEKQKQNAPTPEAAAKVQMGIDSFNFLREAGMAFPQGLLTGQ